MANQRNILLGGATAVFPSHRVTSVRITNQRGGSAIVHDLCPPLHACFDDVEILSP